MRLEVHEVAWLDEQQQFSLAELAELSGMPESDLRQLIDCAVLAPINPDTVEERFGAECLVTIGVAQRLRREFELDADALALPLLLFERIRDLEAQLRALRAQLPQSHTTVVHEHNCPDALDASPAVPCARGESLRRDAVLGSAVAPSRRRP